ncbi:MAG: GNAT family N-acetyltransferase [Oscillospiraceae bacterium]|nr:GNAT family N-acetyltransferase [Oscillospiraceae bacterium]
MQIHLRPLEQRDAPFMLEWMRDPSIACYFRFDAASMTEEKCRAFIESASRDPSSRHYAIADENDEYLGTISLKNIANGSAEYAISTRKCTHGSGAALQATRDILRISFDELGLETVYLNVLAENLRANAFYRKAGFRFTHSEENALELRGERKALNWYEISRTDLIKETNA